MHIQAHSGIFLCVYMLVCLCVCVGGYAGTCAHVWEARYRHWVFSSVVLFFFFKTGSLTELGLSHVVRLSGQWAPGTVLSPLLQCMPGFISHGHHQLSLGLHAFEPSLYQLSHLPRVGEISLRKYATFYKYKLDLQFWTNLSEQEVKM